MTGKSVRALALVEIDRMVSELELQPNVKDTASQLYKRIAEKGLRGHSTNSIISAAVYIAARECGTPRTLKEIAEVSRSPLKKIRRDYIFLLRKLEKKLPPSNPAHYIPRFCSKLGLSEEIRKKATEILKDDKGTEVAKGWGAIGTAGTAIYIAAILSGEKITEKEIAKVVGTTEITIRDRYKELVKRVNIDLDLP